MIKGNVTITQLEYIVAVDKHRHFKRAAKECHVTQPTLSMQVSKLESDIDTIIFDRSKSPILPTLDGEKVIAQAKSILRECKKLYETVEFSKGQITGQLKLGIIPTLSPYLLPLFAESFASKYPQIEIVIDEYKTEEILKLLDEDELDAGILVTPLEGDQVIERVLYYEPFVGFFCPEHKHLKKEFIKDTEIAMEDLWLLKEGHCFRAQVLNICGASKNKDQRIPNLSFESGSLETLKNMVKQGSGYTLLPSMMASNLSPSEKKLVRPFKGAKIPTREVSLVHGRIFLKEKIIDLLEKEIISRLPKEIKTLKKDGVSIVDL